MEIRPLAEIARPSATTRETTERSEVAAEEVRSSSAQFFVSPVLRFDQPSLTVIFQIRDRESGDVTRQFPPETVIERYRQDPSSRPFILPQQRQGEGGDAEVARPETTSAPAGQRDIATAQTPETEAATSQPVPVDVRA